MMTADMMRQRMRSTRPTSADIAYVPSRRGITECPTHYAFGRVNPNHVCYLTTNGAN